jgi:hypothetical protein
MLSHAKHPQQLVAGGTNVAQRFDVKGKQRKEENMKKAVFDFIDTLASGFSANPSVRVCRRRFSRQS